MNKAIITKAQRIALEAAGYKIEIGRHAPDENGKRLQTGYCAVKKNDVELRLSNQTLLDTIIIPMEIDAKLDALFARQDNGEILNEQELKFIRMNS